MGLISLLSGMILTSCNQALKPELSGKSRTNDTFFLLQAHQYSQLEKELAKIASAKSTDQAIRIFAEKIASYQQKTEQVWDSLARMKHIPLPENLTPMQKKEIDNLAGSGKLDRDFAVQMENQLRNNIKHLEIVSRQSEDNDISTFAITILPDLQAQLDSLLAVNQKIKK